MDNKLTEFCVFIKVDTGYTSLISPLAVFFSEDIANDYLSYLESNVADLSISYFIKNNLEDIYNEKK